jgi:hypothetical protein
MAIVLAVLLATATATVSSPTAPPAAHVPFEIGSIRLLQPEALVDQRTTATELSKTIQAITAMARAWSLQVPGGDACIVYVAIRPADRLKTWTVCKSADGATLDARVSSQVAAADIADVRGGTVVFSIHGKAAWASGLGAFHFPKAWDDAAKGESVEMTELADRAWKD